MDTGHDDEVMIKGRWYKVDEFVKRHPGGRILNYYRGKDASEAYTEFHYRSEKAKKMLDTLQVSKRPATLLIQDFLRGTQPWALWVSLRLSTPTISAVSPRRRKQAVIRAGPAH